MNLVEKLKQVLERQEPDLPQKVGVWELGDHYTPFSYFEYVTYPGNNKYTLTFYDLEDVMDGDEGEWDMGSPPTDATGSGWSGSTSHFVSGSWKSLDDIERILRKASSNNFAMYKKSARSWRR